MLRDILLVGVSLAAGVWVLQAHGNGLELAVAQTLFTSTEASARSATTDGGDARADAAVELERRVPVPLVSATVTPPAAGHEYPDGPPPGFSGGFGEDHCQACHFSDRVNASPGSLTISAPERYSPGETCTVTVTLTRPGMVIGGFELTARFEEGGAQAGTLALAEGDQDRIKVVTDRGVQYAYHLRAGTRLTGPNVVRWTLRWTAPASGGSVLFHAAANAANQDESQFGDFVYTAWVRSANSEALRARRSSETC